MSTAHAALAFVKNIIQSFENKQYYEALFIDLTKAFDTVSHDILLNKLVCYNFDKKCIALIKSYLSERSQVVSVNNVRSKACEVTHGVPQGSILGPILFLLYINDLPQCLPTVDSVLYADDTTIGKSDTSLERLEQQLHVCYKRAESWLSANRLHLNKQKTIKMIFTLKNLDKIDNTESLKFLGITLDPHLTWQAHIDTVAQKIIKYLYLVRNLSNAVSLSTLRTAYFALFQSHIEYCIILWGHSLYSVRLFKIQRKVIRIIANLPYREDCRAYFHSLGILTLPSLYILRCLEYILKNMNLYTSLKSFHNYNTRGDDLCINRLRVTKSRLGFNYFCIKFFNVLPSSLKASPPVILIKNIKTYLLFKSFYSIDEFLTNDFKDINTICSNT